MNADTLGLGAASRIAALAMALLLASCIKSTPTYKIGGTVAGLTGTGLVLQNNGADDLAISANGAFAFSKQLKKDARYSVTVFVQPAGKTCTVSNGSGTVTSDVTNVAVNCTSNGFTVGGTVSGLTGAGLVLQNNGGNNLPIAADAPFTFPTPLSSGVTYSVTVLSQPAGQGCSVANGSGTIAGANVINVAVTCAVAPAAPTLNPIGFGVKELQFSWAAVSGAAFYRLLENPDGVSAFAVAATNIAATSYNHTIPVHRRLNASYKVEACNAGGCTASPAADLGTSLAQAIGYAKASNTDATDQFGFSVAVSGDGNTLAVGALLEDGGASNSGAAYVFTRSSGGWSQPEYLKASNPGANDNFGFALALSDDGNTLAVSARAQAGSGAVYVFSRSGTWSQQAFIKASNAESFARFGSGVALSGDGDTLAVGAQSENSAATGINGNQVNDCSTTSVNCATSSGAAYVYTRSGAVWSQEAYVKASNTGSNDLFGVSVALSRDGNTLAVGAPGEASGVTGVLTGSVSEATTLNAAPGSGATYVFLRTAPGTWSQQAYVKASNTGFNDNFGNSVALSSDGNTLAVGAPFEDSGTTGVGSTPNESAGDAGAAYVFTRSGSDWSQQAYVKASNTGPNNWFGWALALSRDGNTLAVGAPFENGGATAIGGDQVNDCGSGAPINCLPSSGAAYVYIRSTGTWTHQAYVKASNTENLDRFGWTIGVNGDGNTLAVGAPLEGGSATGIGPTQDNNDARTSGAAYLY